MDDCTLKIKLFMGHCIRLHNQRMCIVEIKKELGPSQALILMDFKMKFEPLFYREKSTQFMERRV